MVLPKVILGNVGQDSLFGKIRRFFIKEKSFISTKEILIIFAEYSAVNSWFYKNVLSWILKNIQIYGDSLLIIKQINNEYKVEAEKFKAIIWNCNWDASGIW